jgi:hypothetical protein
VLWQLRHLLGESIHQGLAYSEGRKVGLGHKAIVLLLLLVPHGDCAACGKVKSTGLVFYLGLEAGLIGMYTALIKKNIIKRKFRRDRLQRLAASTYMVKYLRISSWVRNPSSHLNYLKYEVNFVSFFISVICQEDVTTYVKLIRHIHFCPTYFTSIPPPNSHPQKNSVEPCN